MSLESQTESAFTPRTGDEGPGAPRLSVLATAALLAGLASFVAMASPLLWPVAGAALVFCVLVKIYLAHHRGELTGEGVATVGLALALLFVTASPTRYFLRQWRISDQAAMIGREWLCFIVRKEPYNAYESMREVERRRQLSPQLEWQYAADTNEQTSYRQFLNQPLIKAIGLLPSRVDVRHYKTERIEAGPRGNDIITDVFALTWRDEQGEPQTMLVRLEIERRVEPTRVEGVWRVQRYDLVK